MSHDFFPIERLRPPGIQVVQTLLADIKPARINLGEFDVLHLIKARNQMAHKPEPFFRSKLQRRFFDLVQCRHVFP